MALVRLPFLARALLRCLVNPESVFILRQTRWWRGPQFPNASSTIPFKQEGLLIVGTVFVLSAALTCRAKPGATVSVPIRVGRRRFGISPLTTGLVCLLGVCVVAVRSGSREPVRSVDRHAGRCRSPTKTVAGARLLHGTPSGEHFPERAMGLSSRSFRGSGQRLIQSEPLSQKQQQRLQSQLQK